MNLSLAEDRQEDVCGDVSSGPRYNEQQLIYGINSTRFDMHGDDGLAQSAGSSYPYGIANLPGVQDEPDDDHKGEEDVKRN